MNKNKNLPLKKIFASHFQAEKINWLEIKDFKARIVFFWFEKIEGNYLFVAHFRYHLKT
jgi:hypothetical protein